MSLVYGIEGNLYLFEECYVFCFCEGLWCDIKELCYPRKQVVADFRDLSLVEGGVKEMCDAFVSGNKASDGIHLVLHERNERGNDNGCAIHHQGRQLVAQRFSSAGGHEYKSISSGGQVAYHLFLTRLEGVKAEELLSLPCRIEESIDITLKFGLLS